MPADDSAALRWLWDRFGGATGYLVDVGAYDGAHGSLSHRLLHVAGWSGLLVEPLPEAFAALRVRYAGQARVHCAEAAASDHDGRALLHPFQTVSTIEPEWAAACARHWGHVRYGEPIEVRRATLRTLLREAGAPARVDLLKIDAEGHDYEVLRGMDWDRQVPVVVVECPNMLTQPVGPGLWAPDPEVVRFLTDLGYRQALVTEGPNAIFERAAA